MKKSYLVLLVLGLLIPILSGVLAAQIAYEYCIVTVTGQNKNRKVDGALAVECGNECIAGFCHSAPFGNWGVNSNYGGITDRDQFRGWKHLDGPYTKRQWNSCTSGTEFLPPNCNYYNASSCTKQSSSATVTHGGMKYRASTTYCPPPNDQVEGEPRGCELIDGHTVTQANNFMTLYELDRDGNDLVETLYFPGTSVTFTGCDYEGCSEEASSWVNMTSSTSSWVHVTAKLRMKASASLEGACDWNW